MPTPMPRPPTALPRSTATAKRHPILSVSLVVIGLGLSGCTVLAVADLAASAVVGTAGLVVDGVVGTAKIGGKVIGKTADMVFGSDDAAPAAD